MGRKGSLEERARAEVERIKERKLRRKGVGRLAAVEGQRIRDPQPMSSGLCDQDLPLLRIPMGPTPSEASKADQEPPERVSWWRVFLGFD
jgi:hypothetical protein